MQRMEAEEGRGDALSLTRASRQESVLALVEAAQGGVAPLSCALVHSTRGLTGGAGMWLLARGASSAAVARRTRVESSAEVSGEGMCIVSVRRVRRRGRVVGRLDLVLLCFGK